jgi:hypothetical protein
MGRSSSNIVNGRPMRLLVNHIDYIWDGDLPSLLFQELINDITVCDNQ